MYAHSHMDIGRASRYEQAGRQAGLRIPAAVTGVPKARSDRLSCLGSAPRKRRMQAGACRLVIPIITGLAKITILFWNLECNVNTE